MYFATVDLDGGLEGYELDYYRVTVNARGANSKTLYQAGYFDAATLHDLYGTMPTALGLMANDTSATSTTTALDQRFTVIYGANADAIVRQMNLASENATLGTAFGRLLATSAVGDLYEDRVRATLQTDAAKKQNLAVAAVLEETANAVEAAADAEAVRTAIVKGANSISIAIGKPQKFDESKPDEAIKVIAAFRDGLK
jgi:hypothetical protein